MAKISPEDAHSYRSQPGLASRPCWAADRRSREHGHGGLRKYVAVAIALAVLTTASFLTYFPFWDQYVPDNVSRAFMMAVSCAKAMLVMMFFMHLLWEANWKYVLTIPATMMSVFLVLMLVPDIGRRVDHYSQERLRHAAVPHGQADSVAAHG